MAAKTRLVGNVQIAKSVKKGKKKEKDIGNGKY